VSAFYTNESLNESPTPS
jgi:hypothetical protein